MKSLFKLSLITLLFLLFQVNPMAAQKGHKHGHYKNNNKTVVVVNNKPYNHYRHRRIYHPVWGPTYAYHRRWVYFPHYNMYWDNYSSNYIYWGNGMWLRTASPPPVIINVNISEEKKYELKETDDAIDDIYGGNDSHKKEYPEN